MAGGIVEYLRALLPAELVDTLSPSLESLEKCAFEDIFKAPFARLLLGHLQNAALKDLLPEDFPTWSKYLEHRLELILRSSANIEGGPEYAPGYKEHFYVVLALAALDAFVQSNITGPPLSISPTQLLLPVSALNDSSKVNDLRKGLIESLAVDGAAPFRLIPNVELFSLAKTIITTASLNSVASLPWIRLRVNFMHQRLLSEDSISIQSSIKADVEYVKLQMLDSSKKFGSDIRVAFDLENASIQLHDGLDVDARKTLQQATAEREFQFALTGMLGKRTKFQQKDISQLVVLARSSKPTATVGATNGDVTKAKPETIDLNDDTLLESIAFSKDAKATPEIQTKEALPASLKEGDAESELLQSFDATILLLTASSITNTQATDGLTREETLPYATRVIEGGSSNWQVYTQALLIRSRIEGYRSRTVERGLLQLQALVDQVIAETTSGSDQPAPTTFLPKPKEGESASPQERLSYVYQLASPTRWALEAELAARWVSLGGLKTALEIYERLEMWPEVALCWAGTDRDDKARQIVRRQLFHSTSGDDVAVDDSEKWEGKERDPLPLEAPRLYCILGDLDKDPQMYDRAWIISKERYHRAQRSLGRYWYAQKEYAKAAVAYSKAVKVKQLDHATWFAMGCALLELDQFPRAVEVFSRAVQLENEDAESWSNLAVALLNSPADTIPVSTSIILDDEEGDQSESLLDPQRNQKAALKALKQAAKLKRDNHRIWDNILTVAASIVPPPYQDIVTAQGRIIKLRGNTDGEKCVDVKLLSLVVDSLTSIPLDSDPDVDPSKPGLARMVCQLVDRDVVPLITSSAPLWHIVQSLATWRKRPTTALEASEKAWRVVTVQPGWEVGTEAQWNGVVNATVDLVKDYGIYGPQEVTEGLAAGSGALVSKDWKFKGRSAIRTVMGKGKASWEDTKGWETLTATLEELK
jgi:tetratricopeptide (TPR) repeat protein